MPDPQPQQNLATWRAWLLDRVIGITLLACIIPTGLVTVDAYRQGDWLHAAFCWLSLGLLLLLHRSRRASIRVRACASGLLLYLFGAWLLTRGAAVGMLYLLTFPVLLALILDTRVAFVALGLSFLTLTGAGWLLELEIPMVVGYPGDSALRWLTIGSNLVWLGVMMVLITGFLLRRLEHALSSEHRSASLLREVASQVPGMVFRLRLGASQSPEFVYASAGSRKVLDLDAEALQADAREMLRRLHPDDLPALRRQLAGAFKGGLTQHATELRLQMDDGQTRWVQVHANEVSRQADAVVLSGVVTDITERRRAEELIRHQAFTDPLTGLPNRLSLLVNLRRSVTEAASTGNAVCLLLLDLEGLQEINDTHGHAGGDALLVEVGQRLQRVAGPDGFVARVGGDEFVVLCTEPPGGRQGEALAERVQAALAAVFRVNGQQLYITASVGIALHPEDGLEADALMTRADQALHEARSGGGNRCSRFTPELQQRAQRRIHVAQELRQAIARGQLSLVYQPIIDLKSGRVTKAEALLRWQHPELGAVSPAEFVPIAESAGLIDSIGAWVFMTAAQQAKAWRRTLDPQLRIGINHSPLQFRREAGSSGGSPEQLAALGIPGEALIVEITEGLLLEHSDELARQLRELRACGVQVALDDFGTGYSALAYLHRYELDILKIDRSFVSGAASSHTGRSLCRAMVTLAQELGMEVVAEGVETEPQSEWLQSIGCHHAQGWLFARGLPPAEFEAWFARQHARVAEPLEVACG